MNRADSFYTIGSTHHVCQDYTLHGFSKDRPFVIVCDGCSSAPHSDVGARLIAHCASGTLDCIDGDLNDFFDHFVIDMDCHFPFYLSTECLHATLLIAMKEGDLTHLFVMGDGGFAYKAESGIHKTIITHPNSAPYYPYYELYGKKEEYIKHFSPYYNIDTIAPFHRVADTIPLPHLSCSYRNLDWLCLFSDGISSFNRPAEEIIDRLVDFKSLNGKFVERRMVRQLKDWGKEGVSHYDDLAMGAIW